MLNLRQILSATLLTVTVLFCQAGTPKLSAALHTEPVVKIWSMVAPHRSIVVADLSLHKFLLIVRFNIGAYLKETAGKDSSNYHKMQACAAALGIVDKAIELLRESVNAFNNHCVSYNPDIEARFYNLCTYFDDVGIANLEPRHVRAFGKSVAEFNRYISTYYMDRKRFLCKEDSELFERLIRLNLILSVSLVSSDYIDVAWYDKVMDWLLYRPLEFASDHPWVVTAACVAVICAGAYYLHQSHQKSLYAISYKEVPGQKCRECGVNAVVNALVLAHPELESRHAELVASGRQYVEDTRKAKVAPPVQQGTANQTPEVKVQPQIPVRAQDLDFQEVQDLLQHIADHAIAGQKLNVANIVAVQDARISTPSIVTKELFESFKGFHNQQSQVCVLYLGSLQVGGYGHWIAVRIEPSPQAPGGIRALVADSLGGCSFLDSFFGGVNPNLKLLLDFYHAHNPLLAPLLPQNFNFQEFIHAFQEVENVAGILGADAQGSVQDKATRGCGAFANGFNGLSVMGFDATAYPTWKQSFEQAFATLKAYCLENKINLNIPNQAPFAMTQATSFEQFIGWCRGLGGN
ncbi:MAG: hypothetical protein WCW33_01375 [Candidatus Babeliales bacterium]